MHANRLEVYIYHVQEIRRAKIGGDVCQIAVAILHSGGSVVKCLVDRQNGSIRIAKSLFLCLPANTTHV